MDKIIRYTYGGVTTESFLEYEAMLKEQTSKTIPFIIEMEYNAIRQILKIVQIEKDLSNLPT